MPNLSRFCLSKFFIQKLMAGCGRRASENRLANWPTLTIRKTRRRAEGVRSGSGSVAGAEKTASGPRGGPEALGCAPSDGSGTEIAVSYIYIASHFCAMTKQNDPL